MVLNSVRKNKISQFDERIEILIKDVINSFKAFEYIINSVKVSDPDRIRFLLAANLCIRDLWPGFPICRQIKRLRPGEFSKRTKSPWLLIPRWLLKNFKRTVPTLYFKLVSFRGKLFDRNLETSYFRF